MVYGPNPAYGSQKYGYAFVLLLLDQDENVGNSRMIFSLSAVVSVYRYLCFPTRMDLC